MKLGRYEILEELGRGGFGIVYRARDSVLGRYIALKVLHSQLTVDPGFIGRFEQEARLAAQLEHPNLVPVHDLGQEDGRFFIAMGLMTEGSLKDKLKAEGALSEQEILDTFRQIIRGLKFIHENGVMHRDLKPGNILFDQHGTVRISDLGFAKAILSDTSTSLSMSGGLIGTPAYMAPEIWRGKPATPQSDIYSLGCIIYEMLTGQTLFEGETPAESMTKHLIDGPQYNQDLSDNWRELLNKCLAMDPNERFHDINDLFAKFDKKEQDIDPISFLMEYPDIAKDSFFLKPDLELSFSTSNPNGFEDSTNNSDESFDEEVYIERHSKVEILQGLQTQINQVSEIKLSPDGKIIAVAGRSGLQILDFNNLNVIDEYCLDASFTSLSWSADGSFLVLGSGEGTIHIWDKRKTTKPKILDDHNSWTSCVAWSPAGKMLATGSSDGSLHIWDIQEQKKIKSMKFGVAAINDIAWSPSGAELASGSNSPNIVIWKPERDNDSVKLEGHTHWVQCIGWSPKGELLASGSGDGTINVWDTRSHNLLWSLEGHSSWVNSIAWSPYGRLFASASDDKTIKIWDSSTGELLGILKEKSGSISSVAWHPEGSKLVFGSRDGTVKACEIK